jgi:hypothetical protein
MNTTRSELHRLVDRLPDYALDGRPCGRALRPDEIMPVIRDMATIFGVLKAISIELAGRQGPLGAP